MRYKGIDISHLAEFNEEYEPDIDLAMDMGRKGAADAIEAIKRSMILCPTAVEAGVCMLMAAQVLYTEVRLKAEADGSVITEVWNKMEKVFRMKEAELDEAAAKASGH